MVNSISWNEVRDRAQLFSREWADATDEQRDKQTFWNEFFEVFGVPRKSVATFEKAVATARGSHGFIDLFWRGVLLVEHKSAGQNLSKAESQAFDYIAELTREGLHDEVPRFVIVSDFKRFVLYDLEADDGKRPVAGDGGGRLGAMEFPLADLPKVVRQFAFIKGEKPVRLNPEDPANLRATQLLANLHDALAQSGFTGHALERLLVRILFCLFAEDTGIFDAPSAFTALIERTREDGSDLGLWLAQLFQVLDTPENRRQTLLDEDLAAFPYVNGALFAEQLPLVSFSRPHREALLACTRFHWARISPAVFGSLFQGVLDARERRQGGAHYTSERDIMKVIRGLFLDQLRAELDSALADRSTRRVERLREFQKKLRRLRFFDPACGCGNFLILAYRELRRLEQEALVAIHTVGGHIARVLDVREESMVDVDQFFGLEIAEWPVRIAEVGLWLADHQANVELGAALGQSFRRLPLKASPTLQVANALRTDWHGFLTPGDDVFILGNPPFVGHHYQDAEQKADQQLVLADIPARGVLDYVANWYVKAADYVEGTSARCALVSTNSITQGEQAGILWNYLFQRYGLKIQFAHRTFNWVSEARGKAHVHVVIVGFGCTDRADKRIFDYDTAGATVSVTSAHNISPYLMEGPDRAIEVRSTPLGDVPKMMWGNKPTDGGHLILSPAERLELLESSPESASLVRRYMGGGDLLNGRERYCLWLVGADPAQLRRHREVMRRVDAVRAFRLRSDAATTRAYAEQPTLFRQIAQPATAYLAVPEVSSANRRYVPMAFLGPEVICSNTVQFVPDATPYQFGILTSAMHMAWVRTVSGRLKSDYRYSNTLVYNTFPWPNPSKDDRLAVHSAAQGVLDARAIFSDATLADLYDPLTMPAPLVKAHAALDRAVERTYRPKAFLNDQERTQHLFDLYDQVTTPLLHDATTSAGRHGRRTSSDAAGG
ncbi:MAG: DNA methyltransferase [Dehalococcoidia bacterium]